MASQSTFSPVSIQQIVPLAAKLPGLKSGAAVITSRHLNRYYPTSGQGSYTVTTGGQLRLTFDVQSSQHLAELASAVLYMDITVPIANTVLDDIFSVINRVTVQCGGVTISDQINVNRSATKRLHATCSRDVYEGLYSAFGCVKFNSKIGNTAVPIPAIASTPYAGAISSATTYSMNNAAYAARISDVQNELPTVASRTIAIPLQGLIGGIFDQMQLFPLAFAGVLQLQFLLELP